MGLPSRVGFGMVFATYGPTTALPTVSKDVSRGVVKVLGWVVPV